MLDCEACSQHPEDLHDEAMNLRDGKTLPRSSREGHQVLLKLLGLLALYPAFGLKLQRIEEDVRVMMDKR